MSSNKSARQLLERQFGKICMVEATGIRYIPKSERRKIRGYTKYDDVLTFHHIKERAKGGKATPENGALVRGYNHRWLHSLPPTEKEKVNNALVEFKVAFLQHNGQSLTSEGPAQSLTFDYDLSAEDSVVIKAYDNTMEDMEKRQKFNRAKVKRETKRKIDEYYNYDDDER